MKLSNLGDFKPGTKLVCKKDYSYNVDMVVGDIVTVIGANEYNVRIKTHYGTYQNISYTSINIHDLFFWELFYTIAETRQMKLSQILNPIDIH
jgi:hypothetical protein